MTVASISAAASTLNVSDGLSEVCDKEVAFFAVRSAMGIWIFPKIVVPQNGWWK